MSAKKPMVRSSTPSVRSHAGSRLIRIHSGRPEAKPTNTQISIRRLRRASCHDSFAAGSDAGADGVAEAFALGPVSVMYTAQEQMDRTQLSRRKRSPMVHR